jgi:hypothetical protein
MKLHRFHGDAHRRGNRLRRKAIGKHSQDLLLPRCQLHVVAFGPDPRMLNRFAHVCRDVSRDVSAVAPEINSYRCVLDVQRPSAWQRSTVQMLSHRQDAQTVDNPSSGRDDRTADLARESKVQGGEEDSFSNNARACEGDPAAFTVKSLSPDEDGAPTVARVRRRIVPYQQSAGRPLVEGFSARALCALIPSLTVGQV